MAEERIKKALERIAGQAPRPPLWEEMMEGGLRSSRRIRPLTAFLAGAAVVIVVLGVVGLLRDSRDGQLIASSTTTTAPPPATTEMTPAVSTGPITEMACGSVVAPYSTTIPTGEELDADATTALAALAENEEGRFFADEYEFRLWSKDADALTLLGTSPEGYAYASFDGFTPTGWGGCHWQPVPPDGYGLATWTLAGSAMPVDSTLKVRANERNCASGQGPEGRDVVAAVIMDESSVTVTVFVESVEGFAECPSNPDFDFEVELGRPLVDRSLFDGSEVPPVPRSAPPTAVTCVLDWSGMAAGEVAVQFPCEEDFRYQPVARDIHPGMSPIESTLRHLLAGPTPKERSNGLITFFGDDTADALISLKAEDGHVVADFNDDIIVNNASTSFGAVAFNDVLRVNLFAFEEVDSVEFRINGSCEAWSAYFESDGCWVVTRQAYEEGTAPFSP